MNINEDKFANKSAEEIISDMLTQHKNNSKEALEHIQDILKDDGLILGDEAKANLEKAATILSDKGLKEGWFSKDAPKKYAVKFEVYLPFKKEPAQFQIPPVASLNDPLVKETLAKIRARHPKSTIYIRSELGDQRITEDSKKTPKKNQGGLLKQFFSSDVMKHLAAIGATAVTGINPIIAKQFTDIPMNRMARKFENVNQEYQVNLYKENANYTCYAGSLGIALALAEKASEYSKVDVLKENKVICSYDRSLKEWSMNTNENELKEDLETPEDLTTHSYADLRKDIANIDERLNVIDCGLNPNLIDKRRPKWHNIFGNPEFVEVEDPETGEIYHNQEVLVSLNGIDPVINKENPDATEVTIVKKVPYRITERGTTYKNGEEFVVTVGQFKQLLQDPSNAEILAKFEKSKDSAILSDEQKEEFRTLDEWAKKAIDSEYPEWEAAHAKEYNLYNYSLPERAQIYQEYKDLNRTNMYQQARELTADEVDIKYGLPKLKKTLANDKELGKYLTAFESARRGVSAEDQTKLDKSLMKILNSEDDIKTIQRKISKVIGFFGAKAQLNQIPVIKNELAKLQNDLLPEVKADFDKELLNLVANKYVDTKTGLPTVLKNPKEALKDVNTLIAKYKNNTNASKFAQTSANTKGIVDAVKEIKTVFNQIDQTNPELAKQLKDKFIGQESTWKKQHISGDELVAKLNEFLMYCQQVANENSTNKLDTLPDSEKEQQHNNWIYGVQHIENEDSKAEDKTYYTAITNKISRLVKTDPQAANGYYNKFKSMLKDLEDKYPDNPNHPMIIAALVKFLKTLKNETKGDATVTGALRHGLTRKMNKLNNED